MNGSVAVIPEKGIVEVSLSHPEREKVISGLIRLFFGTNGANQKVSRSF